MDTFGNLFRTYGIQLISLIIAIGVGIGFSDPILILQAPTWAWIVWIGLILICFGAVHFSAGKPWPTSNLWAVLSGLVFIFLFLWQSFAHLGKTEVEAIYGGPDSESIVVSTVDGDRLEIDRSNLFVRKIQSDTVRPDKIVTRQDGFTKKLILIDFVPPDEPRLLRSGTLHEVQVEQLGIEPASLSPSALILALEHRPWLKEQRITPAEISQANQRSKLTERLVNYYSGSNSDADADSSGGGGFQPRRIRRALPTERKVVSQLEDGDLQLALQDTLTRLQSAENDPSFWTMNLGSSHKVVLAYPEYPRSYRYIDQTPTIHYPFWHADLLAFPRKGDLLLLRPVEARLRCLSDSCSEDLQGWTMMWVNPGGGSTDLESSGWVGDPPVVEYETRAWVFDRAAEISESDLNAADADSVSIQVSYPWIDRLPAESAHQYPVADWFDHFTPFEPN